MAAEAGKTKMPSNMGKALCKTDLTDRLSAPRDKTYFAQIKNPQNLSGHLTQTVEVDQQVVSASKMDLMFLMS